MAKPELLVGARRFAGWQQATITRSIETISGRFSLAVADRWSEELPAWQVREKDACTVLVDSKPVITGYVDKRTTSFTSDSHGVALTGRDKSCDAVDCSVDLGAWEFRSVNVLAFLNKLTSPYGVKVYPGPGVVPPVIPEKKIAIDIGDKAFDVIDRVARFAGLLTVADGLGNVQLMLPGTKPAPVALVEGEAGILEAEAEYSEEECFSKYVVHGAYPPDPDDEFGLGLGLEAPKHVERVKGEATDSASRAGRTLIVHAEQLANREHAKARAQWEARVRRARAFRARIKVRGWSPAPGYVWTPGDLLTVRAPKLGVTGALVISQATLSLGREDGETADLQLMAPDAFSPIPKPERSWKR